MARTATKKTWHGRHGSSGPRASWRGPMMFGLVSFQVEAFNALDRESSDIHFHQLHAECHRRIHYAKMCPVHGEVPNDEIVSGYEIKKGKYVEVQPEELANLREDEEPSLKIDAFVEPDTIDPLYFDGRMYYLIPSDAHSHEAYAVIAEAMAKKERNGIGRIFFSGKEQIVLVRPLEGVLHMAMLNYEAEIKPAQKVAGTIAKPKNAGKQLQLAQTLIDEWSQKDFDFSKYEDKHREKVKKLIASKTHGKEIPAPKEKHQPAQTLNLMEALKKSLGSMPKSDQKPKKTARAKKSPQRRSA